MAKQNCGIRHDTQNTGTENPDYTGTRRWQNIGKIKTGRNPSTRSKKTIMFQYVPTNIIPQIHCHKTRQKKTGKTGTNWNILITTIRNDTQTQQGVAESRHDIHNPGLKAVRAGTGHEKNTAIWTGCRPAFDQGRPAMPSSGLVDHAACLCCTLMFHTVDDMPPAPSCPPHTRLPHTAVVAGRAAPEAASQRSACSGAVDGPRHCPPRARPRKECQRLHHAVFMA